MPEKENIGQRPGEGSKNGDVLVLQQDGLRLERIFLLSLADQDDFLVEKNMAFLDRDELARPDVWILGEPFDTEVDLDIPRPAQVADLLYDPYLGLRVDNAAPAEFECDGRELGQGDLLSAGYPAEKLGEGGRDVMAALARYRTVIFGTMGCKNEVLDLACADGFYIFLAEVLNGAADLTGEVADG